MRSPSSSSVAVIGAGPAGLMAAETLAAAGLAVDVYDAMPSVGRKFLLAGVGGMNITHSEEAAGFVSRYREASPWVSEWLAEFDASQLREWIHSLGIDTFIGSSGRVFPSDMKAAPLLRAWLRRLREQGVSLHNRHRWIGWNAQHQCLFDTPQGQQTKTHRAVILALGGGSWSRLGSDGAWVNLLQTQGIKVRDLLPANGGFTRQWSSHLSQRFAGHPLKQIIARLVLPDGSTWEKRGECIVTHDGLEGSLIYALSAPLRDQLLQNGQARLTLDLAPDRTGEQLAEMLRKPRSGQTLASVLRKRAGLDTLKIALLHECLDKQIFSDAARLAASIKTLPVELTGMRPLDEAISSAGGVVREAFDQNLMLKDLPGVFCAGEMLNWEAPTGGYLLTACFASGRRAGQGAIDYLGL
ncbi:TIGR03862 family flavoprotein [Halopseudomonas pelagia]|uniref:TIGR03862 family flavoprotein n=1 Tax=Halopseudomonas pelagia TaxID=553151 RepID=UPI0030D7C7A2|tara:strand:- start:354 stop:1589 length:1236 start_codon:yes stop_codon:yes gene_type:complete